MKKNKEDYFPGTIDEVSIWGKKGSYTLKLSGASGALLLGNDGKLFHWNGSSTTQWKEEDISPAQQLREYLERTILDG